MRVLPAATGAAAAWVVLSQLHKLTMALLPRKPTQDTVK